MEDALFRLMLGSDEAAAAQELPSAQSRDSAKGGAGRSRGPAAGGRDGGRDGGRRLRGDGASAAPPRACAVTRAGGRGPSLPPPAPLLTPAVSVSLSLSLPLFLLMSVSLRTPAARPYFHERSSLHSRGHSPKLR